MRPHLSSKESRLKEFRIDASTRLRELAGEDAGSLYALVDGNRKHLRQWLAWVDMQQGPDDSGQFIEGARKNNKAGVALTLGIEHEGEIAGVIGFPELDNGNRKASMGYWISSSHQGKGIISRSCERLIEYALTDLGLNRVEVRIAEDNVRSRRVAERIGLAYEGTCRQSAWLYDHFENLAIYAAVADQWLSHKRQGD